MKFTKMHGAGNDFVIINNFEENIPVEKLNYIAKTVCTRRMSVGADGLMVVDHPEEGGDYKMRFYNADGTAGEMCGNGARCICRYGYEKGLAGEKQHVETPAGMVIGHRITNREYKIRLNNPSVFEMGVKLEVMGKEYECSYIELGNPGIPHTVVRIEGLKDKTQEEMRALGEAFRYHPYYHKGVNVNFFDIIGDEEVVELTYERGVEDFTLACGTGTGSMVSTLYKLGLSSGQNVKVHVPGGLLKIDLNVEDGEITDIFLTGPTNIVAEGELTDEDLQI